jgi:hypothetical protein
MNIKTQTTLSSCGPYAIYNLGCLMNFNFDIKTLKNECKTDNQGTFEIDFEQTLGSKINFIKKEYFNISSLKKDLKKYNIILAYDYCLGEGEFEGHYSTISLINNMVYSHNSYYICDAISINNSNKSQYFKKSLKINYEEFNKYLNVTGYLIKKLSTQ